MALIKSSTSTLLMQGAIVLDLGDLRRQGEDMIAAARHEAQEIVRGAQAERAVLIGAAAAEGRAEGLAEGLAAGHAQGMDQGRQAAQREHGAALSGVENAWRAALTEFVGAREAMLADARRDLLALACEIARRVVGRVVTSEPEIVREQLARALALVQRPTRVRVTVHPEAAALAAEALPALAKELSAAEHAEIVADAAAPRGACVVRLSGDSAAGTSGAGEIDASLETQLERIVEALVPGRGTVSDKPTGDPAAQSAGDPAQGAGPSTGGGA
ncbi:hypothetical protein BH11PLA1_BH11PLA1_08950 [soil metagenome]